MKNTLKTLLFTLVLTLGLFSFSVNAQVSMPAGTTTTTTTGSSNPPTTTTQNPTMDNSSIIIIVIIAIIVIALLAIGATSLTGRTSDAEVRSTTTTTT